VTSSSVYKSIDPVIDTLEGGALRSPSSRRVTHAAVDFLDDGSMSDGIYIIVDGPYPPIETAVFRWDAGS